MGFLRTMHITYATVGYRWYGHASTIPSKLNFHRLHCSFQGALAAASALVDMCDLVVREIKFGGFVRQWLYLASDLASPSFSVFPPAASGPDYMGAAVWSAPSRWSARSVTPLCTYQARRLCLGPGVQPVQRGPPSRATPLVDTEPLRTPPG